ncbi:MAG: YbhB/YbcL family Raf kinase inhibitor-like protein [Kofleriaceae bacterium]|nr:YbhB/YbcL family Raf kinase inhibitor-like protein [Kofleriaceae bacterium]
MFARPRGVLLVMLVLACGDDGGVTPPIDSSAAADASPAVDAAPDAPVGTFTLTSPTIIEGGTIPLTHVCTNQGGQNRSPELAWTNPPAGTQSFAVVFTDRSNNLVHSVIYDIPASATGLPADVDNVYAPPEVPGAHQTTGYDNATRGYLGPCPGSQHTYELAVYALSAPTLPNATMSTTRAAAVTAIMANDLGVATLTATHTPP